jgi:hypothetical protein
MTEQRVCVKFLPRTLPFAASLITVEKIGTIAQLSTVNYELSTVFPYMLASKIS